MVCDFVFNSDISSNNYCATAVLYVSLANFRNIFKFKTTEISNNSLNADALTNSTDITYYVDSSSFPDINLAHAMLDDSGSEGIIYTSSRTSNLVKHDFIYYMANEMFGKSSYAGLFTNIVSLKNATEEHGWTVLQEIRQTLLTADNSGNGTSNSTSNSTINITKRFMEQIKYHDNIRLSVGDATHILDTSGVQSVPFIEGDSINFFNTLKSNESDRIYRIKLHLTDLSGNNTIPVDSIANTTGYLNITSDGVP
jgi:hypothetical protein